MLADRDGRQATGRAPGGADSTVRTYPALTSSDSTLGRRRGLPLSAGGVEDEAVLQVLHQGPSGRAQGDDDQETVPDAAGDVDGERQNGPPGDAGRQAGSFASKL